ncbi:MAG: hypothetical protein JXQ29_06430, partial [Planctomycetes bacterium]|nr:hypothetical protein [Planctomycetota bacterium]
LALGRFRIQRPLVVFDPERRPPVRPVAGGAAPPAAARAGDSKTWAVDLPLVVSDGRFEVLPAGDRPGLRLEKLGGNGHFLGSENRVRGMLRGELVTGERRELLQLSGDVVLGDRAHPPSGLGICTIGGIDLAAARPLLAGTAFELLQAGVVRLDGEVQAEGGQLLIRTRLGVEGLRLASLGAPERRLEEPEVHLEVEAAYEPGAERLVVRRGSLRAGASLEVDFSGFVDAPGRETAEMVFEVRGNLERLHALAPAAEAITGRLEGRFGLEWHGPEAVLRGRAEVRDLVVVLPAEAAGADAGVRSIREERLAVELDASTYRAAGAERSTAGTVRLRGEALELEARLESVEPQVLGVAVRLGGDAARVLAQAGVALPLGLVASGAIEAEWDGILHWPPAGATTAGGRIRWHGPAARCEGLEIEALALEGGLEDDGMRIESLRAGVNGGTVEVRGQVGWPGPGARFDLELETKGVGVTQLLAPLIQYAIPLYHLPEGVDGRIGGALSGTVAIRGPLPPRSPADLALLEGSGRVRVDRGFVEGSPVVGEVLAQLGRRGRYEFEDLQTTFRLSDSTVFHESFQARGRELAWGFKGTTRLDTAIDYRLDPGALLDRLDGGKKNQDRQKGWERVLREAFGRVEELPISIGGTLDAPRLVVRVPGAPEGGEDPVGELLEGLLGGRKTR